MIIPRYANIGRIVGVRSTEQSVGIKVGAFDPDIYHKGKTEDKIMTNEKKKLPSLLSARKIFIV